MAAHEEMMPLVEQQTKGRAPSSKLMTTMNKRILAAGALMKPHCACGMRWKPSDVMIMNGGCEQCYIYEMLTTQPKTVVYGSDAIMKSSELAPQMTKRSLGAGACTGSAH
jgi:hypothetical protein